MVSFPATSLSKSANIELFEVQWDKLEATEKQTEKTYMPGIIASYYQGILQQIRSEVDLINSLFQHQGIKGEGNEAILRELIPGAISSILASKPPLTSPFFHCATRPLIR